MEVEEGCRGGFVNGRRLKSSMHCSRGWAWVVHGFHDPSCLHTMTARQFLLLLGFYSSFF